MNYHEIDNVVKTSVIWLNYNSMGFIDIALRSLDSFLNLDFDDYELIVVDNASTDGSFERVRRFVEERRPSNVRVKVIRNDRNLGYAGGMNVGWEARDPDSRYVAFVNNDLIATPQSLTKLIEHMEGDEKIAATSGLIHYGDGKTIYSAGGWVNELWIADGICHGALDQSCTDVVKEYYVTYADGAYMVTRVSSVRQVMPHGRPFIDSAFLFFDDYVLGLALWNRGFRVKYVPIPCGIHYHGKTISASSEYYGYRAHIALSNLVETRYKYSWIYNILMVERRIYKLLGHNKYRALIEGLKLGEKAISLFGKSLNLYCAPYVKVNFIEAFTYLVPIKFKKERIIMPRDITFEEFSCI